MAKTIAIMQPTYLPWIGYFELMDKADIFVYLDTVQFEKQDWQQRNRIKAGNGQWIWLSVPVIQKLPQQIRHVSIATQHNWQIKHWKSICQHYGRCPFWAEYGEEFKKIYETPWSLLIDINLVLISTIKSAFGLSTKTCLASELPVRGNQTGLLIDICRHFRADYYLSPVGSARYLEESLFGEAGITLIYQQFVHPEYRQAYKQFVSHLSAIDLIMNEGPNSMNIIRAGSGPY